MENFKNYMDHVHAYEESKQTTKQAVINALRQTAPGTAKSTRRKYSKGRVFAASFAALAACLVFGGAAYAYYETPVDYVSLDINPSVELGINAFQKIVRAQGINQDGTDLIGNLNLHNMSAEDAVRMLVAQACEQGYIAQNGSTVIALAAQSDTALRADALSEQSGAGAQAALQEQDASAVLYGDTADITIRTQAQEMGISAGKYKLMLALQAMDPSLDIGWFKNATVSQIMLKAAETAGNADQAGGLTATIQNMRRTALQINQQSGTGQTKDSVPEEQEPLKTQQKIKDQQQENTAGQQQDQTQEQAQTQDQTQTQDQAQTQDQTQASCEPTGYAEQNQNSGEQTGQEQEQNESDITASSSAGSQAQSETKQEEQAGGQDSGKFKKGNQ